MSNTLILMKGILCAGKSTIVDKLKQEYNAVLLSSDTLRQIYSLDQMSNEVFDIITKMAHDSLKQGRNVIIDETNLTHKRHRHYLQIAKKHNAKFECHYVIAHPYIWEQNAQKRIDEAWHDYDMDRMYMVRQSMYKGLGYPFEKEFDKITYHVTDIEVDKFSLDYVKHFYQNHKDTFLNNTEQFFATLYHCGFLKDVLPELYAIYGFNQENKHHNLTLEKHTYRLCQNLQDKNEVMVWAGVLHDLGKVTNGIKQRHDDGNCSYIGHQGASTEIAHCILTRLGFERDFVQEVCEIVNKHMFLSYGDEISKKSIDFLGQELYNKLVAFRESDMNAKDK